MNLPAIHYYFLWHVAIVSVRYAVSGAQPINRAPARFEGRFLDKPPEPPPASDNPGKPCGPFRERSSTGRPGIGRPARPRAPHGGGEPPIARGGLPSEQIQ